MNDDFECFGIYQYKLYMSVGNSFHINVVFGRKRQTGVGLALVEAVEILNQKSIILFIELQESGIKRRIIMDLHLFHDRSFRSLADKGTL